MVQSAVIREITIIGEAARNVSEELKNRYTTIQWKKIIGMRNKLVHDYFGIIEEIVWDTIHKSITPLIPQLQAILDAFSDET